MSLLFGVHYIFGIEAACSFEAKMMHSKLKAEMPVLRHTNIPAVDMKSNKDCYRVESISRYHFLTTMTPKFCMAFYVFLALANHILNSISYVVPESARAFFH